MTKTSNQLATCFGCLAVVFLVLGALAVSPQEARAYDGGPCDEGVCPPDWTCVDGNCLAVVDCSTNGCQKSDSTCNANCLGKVCTGGSSGTATCANHSLGYCYCP
jgi:hypothetical protein